MSLQPPPIKTPFDDFSIVPDGAPSWFATWLQSMTVSLPWTKWFQNLTTFPVITNKRGSGASDYTTSSATYVDVDATNLSLTVTVPIGWKLAVWASADGYNLTGAPGLSVRIFDATASVSLQSVTTNPPLGNSGGISLMGQVSGDGAAHTIKLQFHTGNASDSANLRNAGDVRPSMLFILSPSNG